MTKRKRGDLKLTDCWLYAISSPADLARRLSTPKHQVSREELLTLAGDKGNFKLFEITSATGKPRPIQEPRRRIQILHSRIHTLLSRVEVPDYLHSAVGERSYLSNAGAHDPSLPAIKIDIKKFFPSVTRAAVFSFFAETLKCRRDVAGYLADFHTFDEQLPTGSSASPILAYYASKKMFDEIADLATAKNLVMTCYVDDITLSGLGATNAVLLDLRKIITRHGLKSHKAHAFSGSQPKVITGVCNTSSGRRVPNKLHLKIKRGFDELGITTNAKARQKVLGQLLGRLDAAGNIDPAFKARATTLRSIQI